MNLKYLFEEHQKIYPWKYSNCQNIYLNQYPYAISINNKISNFEQKTYKYPVTAFCKVRDILNAKLDKL